MKKCIYCLTLFTPQPQFKIATMKKIVVSCLLLALAFNNLLASHVKAYLTFASFNVPGKGPYLETYISVIGNTVKFVKNKDAKYQGAVDISVGFIQNGVIKSANKYTLNSPELADTAAGFPNFLDQQRYVLSNGSYEMEITITDKNDLSHSFTTKTPININFTDELVAVSDIQLLESYTRSVSQNQLTKSGYDLVPYVSNFFPENITAIRFYSEIYNSRKIMGEAQKMVINYFIESVESKTKLTDFSAFLKQTANDVNILLSELNIQKLPSGNYNLVVEIRDKDNKIQAEQKYFFQRVNKPVALSFEDLKTINVSKTFVSYYKSKDSLSDYIRSLRPISSFAEIQYSENQLQGKNLELMQQYFYNFWKSRNDLQPELAWLEYAKEVLKVNKEFGTFGLKGYDTDRGRVYLRYGPPSQRNKVDSEPSAYPYEIWQYDALSDRSQVLNNPYNRQANKRFIFYNPDLVSNKYILIHSTAKGEINNSKWELMLHSRNNPSNDIDNEKARDHIGGNADENFLNPR